jgi:hypothetical protein
MSNLLRISKLNGVIFYEITPALVPQYLSKDADDYPLVDQLRREQTPVIYAQKWINNDSIPLQFASDFSDIQIQIVDCHGVPFLSPFIPTKRKADKFNPGNYVYEANIALNSLTPGRYWLKMILNGGAKLMISEPMDVAASHRDTFLFEYWNTKYFGDILFETGIHLRLRVECIKSKVDQSNARSAFIDQRYNPQVLNAVPYRQIDLLFGKDYGVPDWIAEKINWIFSCDNVLVDGKPYAVIQDSKLEPVDVDPIYPMRPFTLKVQDGINRASKLVGVDVDPSKKYYTNISVDSTIFGDTSENAGSNIIQIIGLE